MSTLSLLRDRFISILQIAQSAKCCYPCDGTQANQSPMGLWMVKVEEFITGSRHADAFGCLTEKSSLLAAHALKRNGTMQLAAGVYEAVTAWRLDDTVDELLEIVALAAAVDTGKSADAINQAIQQLFPVFREPTDASELEAADKILIIALHYFEHAHFNIDYIDLYDLVESHVPIKAELLARILKLLVDEQKRGGQTISLHRAIAIIYSSCHYSAEDVTYREDLTAQLIHEFPTAYWASQLPLLKLQAYENGDCAICTFIKAIFERRSPFLLLVGIHPYTDWVLKTATLEKYADLGPDDFESLVRAEGYELPPSEHLPADLDGPEFFDRVASARPRSKVRISDFRNTVVPLFPGSRVAHPTETGADHNPEKNS